MRHFTSVAALAATVGESFGPSHWVEVTQQMIDDFARTTGDAQWIHVDVERAAREAPGGTTIAHGYLLLSLLGRMLPDLYSVEAGTILNYGSNKLRFLAAVPSGSRIRLHMVTRAAEPVAGGYRIISEATVEIHGAAKPALVAEIIFLYFD